MMNLQRLRPPPLAWSYVYLALLAIAVMAGSSCAILDESRRWVGSYADPAMSLSLLDSGQFRYQGHYYPIGSDAGRSFEVSGYYKKEGDWINLIPVDSSPFFDPSASARLTGFRRKFYAVEITGEKLLFSDEQLAQIANSLHVGQPWSGVRALRRDGKPVLFSVDPTTWLPQPYVGFAKGPAVTGSAIEVGETRTTTITTYAAGRYSNSELGHARVTINLGSNDRVFDGVRLCSPSDKYLSLWVESVEPHQSVVWWQWRLPNGTPPSVGMSVSSWCP